MRHLLPPLLHRWTRSPCLSFIYNDFVNSVTECSPLSHHAANQSVTQPNPIKWLLMNFKQVLSPSSTCAMLHSPPAPTMRGLTLSFLLLFTLFPFCFFDMLKLLLSHMLNGIFFFCLIQSLCAFVVPLSRFVYFAPSLYPPLFSRNMKQFREVLFFIYNLHPPSLPSSPSTCACLSPVPATAFFFTCSICPPLSVFPFLFYVHPCPPPLSSPLVSLASKRCSIFR